MVALTIEGDHELNDGAQVHDMSRAEQRERTLRKIVHIVQHYIRSK
jgi:hypothetical protein